MSLTESSQIRSEMNEQLRRIDNYSAAECIDYMRGLYEHDLAEDSPLDELQAEAKAQCRRDYESALTSSEKADWNWVDAMVAAGRRG